MSAYHAVTITICFGVLADSPEEAEQIASELTTGMSDELPARARVSLDAMCTLNQNDYIKREAVNYHATQQPTKADHE